jgi:uncharacterized protein (DUF934 family)
MKVIKEHEVQDDAWQLLDDAADVPEQGDVIVGLVRWNQNADALLARSGKVAVVLRSNESPDDIQRRDELALVAIDFPKFADGRGYSNARRLRERLGFEGEIRAVGDVLRDQLFYMHRCGIDSFALKAGKDIAGALDAFREFSVTYQAAADDPRPLFRRVAR